MVNKKYIQPVKFKTELKKSSAILRVQEYVNENIGDFLDGEEVSFEYIDEFGEVAYASAIVKVVNGSAKLYVAVNENDTIRIIDTPEAPKDKKSLWITDFSVEDDQPRDIYEAFNSLSSEYKKLKDAGIIHDVILRDCTFKPGCSSVKHKLIISDHGNPKPFQSFSIIEQILQEKRNLSLPVHLYILPTHDSGEYPTDDSKIVPEKDIFPHFVDTIWEIICKRAKIELQEE